MHIYVHVYMLAYAQNTSRNVCMKLRIAIASEKRDWNEAGVG